MAAPAISRADQQRQLVLARSAEIFSRRGFRATSMNEIAAAVGLSKPTLYHYFRNKEELLVRLYSEVLDESLQLARQTIAAASTPLGAIRDLITSRVEYTCEKQHLLTVFFEEEHELPAELAEEVLRRRRAFQDLFHAALEEHLSRYPHLRETIRPTVYVNTCLGAVNWTYKWYRPSGALSPGDLGRQMATALTAIIDVPG